MTKDLFLDKKRKKNKTGKSLTPFEKYAGRFWKISNSPFIFFLTMQSIYFCQEKKFLTLYK